MVLSEILLPTVLSTLPQEHLLNLVSFYIPNTNTLFTFSSTRALSVDTTPCLVFLLPWFFLLKFFLNLLQRLSSLKMQIDHFNSYYFPQEVRPDSSLYHLCSSKSTKFNLRPHFACILGILCPSHLKFTILQIKPLYDFQFMLSYLFYVECSQFDRIV